MKSSTMNNKKLINKVEPIKPGKAGTLSGLFLKRVHATPNKTAYHYFDEVSKTWKSLTWSDAYIEVSKWRLLFQNLG